MAKQQTARARWDELQQWKQPFLDRAIECSKLTLPHLIPESARLHGSRNYDDALPSLYQGAGARNVNTLAAKLLLALYPPGQPFFQLTLDEGELDRLAEEQGAPLEPEALSQIDQQLSRFERRILEHAEKLALRPVLVEALKHLIVGGNGLLYVGQGGIRFYGLPSICIERDPEGNWSEILVREEVSWSFIPKRMHRRAGRYDDNDGGQNFAEVLTWVKADPSATGADQCMWHQEVEGIRLKGNSGRSTLDRCPWIPLRMNRVAGESYGRSLVEDVLGDLRSLESLSQATVEGSLAMAKLVLMCNPNGLTRAVDIANAKNGDVVPGSAADVAVLTMDKQRDYASAFQQTQVIERRLAFVFMATETVQRDAERVTAEEVRLMAQQLEQQLGGVYSVLAQEMQQPLIRRLMALMERDGLLPNLPADFVNPQVITGLEAIGRGNDRNRLANFIQVVAGTLGPEQFLGMVKPQELVRRFAASDGIDTDGLIKTEEELQAEAQAAEQARLQQSIVEARLRGGPSQPQGPNQGQAQA